MRTYRHHTQKAARRIAVAAWNDDRRPPVEGARLEVDSWFADLYGWPLTPPECQARDRFMGMVCDELHTLASTPKGVTV